MILAIDIGNTNIVVGCIDHQATHFIERLSTDRSKTEVEYAIILKNVLAIYQIRPEALEGCLICSVVPQLTHVVKIAVQKLLKKEIMVLGPGIKTGMNILTDNPAQVGSDLVAAAVGAVRTYPAPLVIFDMGTATTAAVVDRNQNYIGTLILPGVQTSLDALTARAAQLGGIELTDPKRVVGRNTIESMRSGVIYGNAASLDGIIERIEEELREPVTAVATGGLADSIIPHCKREILLDEDLLLKGLLYIYEKNSSKLFSHF